jgi:hypothetical protein
MVAASQVWTESSFEEFRDGQFDDGGANVYVSRQGSIELINRWDLNQDGFLDLVFANTHPHSEKQDAVIFWGNGKDFDISRMSYVPNDGAQAATASDLDKDGQMDLVLPNYTNGSWDGMDSYVYYGGIEQLKKRSDSSQWGFHPFARKITLPSRAAQRSAVEDLNKDGYPDIVFAFSAGFWEYRKGGREGGYAAPSRIYWGSKEGFGGERYTDLPAFGASAVAIADLNQDSWPDIAFANREDAGNTDISSYVYWGGPQGFDAERRLELPTKGASAVALADVDGDGSLDAAFANSAGPASYIYLNSRQGFRSERRLELPTNDARDCAVGDLNNDGLADVFFTNHQVANNPLTVSYLYWGSEDGFSADSREDFETVGAWGVSLADLNRDGWHEIIISNYKEHFSYDVPSYVYWNSPQGFAPTRRTSLFTHGAVGNTAADLNGDGHLDLLFNNTAARSRGGVVPVFVYWGDENGDFNPNRRLSLPSVDPYEWAAADLNQDGWADLIVANFGETVRWRQESYIFWGDREGFDESRRSALNGNGSIGVSVADLDEDGFLDVLLPNSPKPVDDDPKGAFIYWGSPEGYVVTERTELPTGPTGTGLIADINRDGHLDLLMRTKDQVTGVFWGDGTRNYGDNRVTIIPESKGAGSAEAADLNRDGYLDLILTRSSQASRRAMSHIYWGNEKGEYSADNRQPFETEGIIVVTVADVDQDGWLDLVCPNYNTGSSRSTLSRIFMGGPDGVKAERMFVLPTNSGTGSMVADFNRDGYSDVLFVCHRSEGDPNKIGDFGDHLTDSFLYWGGPNGFSVENRLGVPAEGPHQDSVVDLGHIYDRRLEWKYTSSAHNYGGAIPRDIAWQSQQPYGSRVLLQIRTAASEEGLEDAPWSGPSGAGTYYEHPSSVLQPAASHSWIQYRATLRSPYGAASPALEEVTIVFRE